MLQLDCVELKLHIQLPHEVVRTASIGLCGIEIELLGSRPEILIALQLDCVELKFGVLVDVERAQRVLQLDCVELK